MLTLPNPLHQLWTSLAHRGEYEAGASRLRYAVSFSKWQLDAFFGPRCPADSPDLLTVIILSWRRVRNIQPMVRSLLKCDFVGRIIVSNNNPEYRIRDWVTIESPRLEVVDQPRAAMPGMRLCIARRVAAPYYLCIDDDIFLYPRQVRALFDALRARPDAPHGLQGEIHASTGWRAGQSRFEGRVDVLNCVYAFTREHVEEMFRLADLLGIDVATNHHDDILISFGGATQPSCHDLGPFPSCLSWARRSVAIWRTDPAFSGRRADRYRALARLKPLEDRVDPARRSAA